MQHRLAHNGLGSGTVHKHVTTQSVPVLCPTQLRRAYRRLRVLAHTSSDDLVRQVAKEVEELKLRSSSPGVFEERLNRSYTAGPNQLPVGTVLGGKYIVTGVLGSGSNATTYQATAPDGSCVAVKALSLRGLRDWKQLDMFQREAQTLRALEHTGIPKYIDYFEEDSEGDRAFFIVQAAVPGLSLAQMLAQGMRATDAEAERIARELLQVLRYLASLRPPVVHRDVKPENIVIEGGQWGGRAFLVDFGGVAGVAAAQDAASFASTVVGTYGYMAPEQFRGSAQPASDLYALGGTLLFLLSGLPPSAFPQERMRLQWRAGGSSASSSAGPAFSPPSPTWSRLLEGLLEPLAEDRLSAEEALQVLDGKRVLRNSEENRLAKAAALHAPQSPLEARMRLAGPSGGSSLTRGVVTRKPAGSRVQLERTAGRLDITIPPKGLLSGDTLFTGAFAVAWNAFVAVWTVGALAGGGLLMALFSAPFWFAGVQLGKQAFGSALVKERFAVGRSRFRIGQELAVFNGGSGSPDFLGGNNERVTEGLTQDLTGARVVTTMFVNDVPQTAIEILEGVRKYRFGEGLETEEQQWLVYEINQALEDLKGGPIDYASFPAAEMPKTFRDDRDDTA